MARYRIPRRKTPAVVEEAPPSTPRPAVLSSEERRAQDLRATLQHINKFTAEKSPRIEKRMKTAIGIAKAPWSSARLRLNGMFWSRQIPP